MITLPKDFKEFLKLLRSKGIEYLIVGGYAVGLYGYPRATGDIDIWVAINENNALNLVDAMKEFGFKSSDINKDLFLKKDKVIRMGVPPLRIEVITSIDGVNFDECYKKRNSIVVDDIQVNFISLSDLIKNKKACRRHKDFDDLEHLSDIKK